MRRLPLVAVLAAALAVPAAAEARPTCAQDAAKLRKRLPGYEQRLPYSRQGRQLCFDLTGDGRRDVALTRFDFMSGGPHRWAAFRRTRTGWKRLIFSGDCCSVVDQSGRGLRLSRTGRSLDVRQVTYDEGDANCCPTGEGRLARWTWDGRALVATFPED